MSDWGRTLADFIRGLYWLVGIMAAVIVALIAVAVWLVLR